MDVVKVSIPFKRESVSKELHIPSGVDGADNVSIPFKRESVSKETLFCTQSVRGSRTPKPYANCAVLFFSQNLPLKSHKP